MRESCRCAEQAEQRQDVLAAPRYLPRAELVPSGRINAGYRRLLRNRAGGVLGSLLGRFSSFSFRLADCGLAPVKLCLSCGPLSGERGKRDRAKVGVGLSRGQIAPPRVASVDELTADGPVAANDDNHGEEAAVMVGSRAGRGGRAAISRAAREMGAEQAWSSAARATVACLVP